jgi:hypothetical protein
VLAVAKMLLSVMARRTKQLMWRVATGPRSLRLCLRQTLPPRWEP